VHRRLTIEEAVAVAPFTVFAPRAIDLDRLIELADMLVPAPAEPPSLAD
jgi:hypothetical protein